MDGIQGHLFLSILKSSLRLCRKTNTLTLENIYHASGTAIGLQKAFVKTDIGSYFINKATKEDEGADFWRNWKRPDRNQRYNPARKNGNRNWFGSSQVEESEIEAFEAQQSTNLATSSCIQWFRFSVVDRCFFQKVGASFFASKQIDLNATFECGTGPSRQVTDRVVDGCDAMSWKNEFLHKWARRLCLFEQIPKWKNPGISERNILGSGQQRFFKKICKKICTWKIKGTYSVVR